FSIISGNESGEWMESPDGNYARLGQAISKDGIPGGDYIVAADVAKTGALCLEPTGLDTAGYLARGNELAVDCTIEEMLQPSNTQSALHFFLFPLINYSTTEVCTSSTPHPDRVPEEDRIDGAYCYTGYGAALNDINGTERDQQGMYFGGQEYCHTVIASGYEATGAK